MSRRVIVNYWGESIFELYMKLTAICAFKTSGIERKITAYLIRTLSSISSFSKPRRFLWAFILIFIPVFSYAAELIYTIQIESFVGEKDSRRFYEAVEQQLDVQNLDSLRIEKVGKYYAVRLGNLADRAKAEDLLKAVRPKLSSAIVMEAYMKDERIVLLYEGVRIKSSDYSESVSKAKEMVQEGKNAEALSFLSPFISDPAEYPVAVSDYIVILVWEGRYAEAIGIYESLPESFPKKNYLQQNMAKAYYESKNYSKALSGYEAMLTAAPLDLEVQKGVVYSLTGMNELTRALNYVNDFLAKSPGSPDLAYAKAEVLIKQHDYLEALRQYNVMGQRGDADREGIYRLSDKLLDSLSEAERREVTIGLSKAVQAGARELLRDYLHALVLNKDYGPALKFIDSSGKDISTYPADIRAWIAWAYFKTDNSEKAKLLYKEILDGNPKNAMVNIDYSYCLSKDGQGAEAIKILDPLLSENPQNLKALFARAYASEQTGRFWDAVEDYDRVLAIDPASPDAKKLRLMALSDMGASTHAEANAQKDFPADQSLHETFKGDMAADRIAWKEYPIAINMLQPQIEDKTNLRARNDYVLALTENTDMEEAVKVYEQMLDEGITPPAWALDEAAKAYLYLEQPHKALELYDRVLEIWPNYDSRMGRFDTLQELRKWDEAKKALADLDNDIPAALGTGKNMGPNWDKMEIALAKGWFLLYEDRLKEGGEYFSNMHEQAPADAGFRTGLSHAYLWRGWPRKALREFNITETLDPLEVAVKIGKASTLNELAVKEQAREDAAALLEKYPKNKHVIALARKLEVEEKREFVTDVSFAGDDDGFQEVTVAAKLTQPVSLYTDIYGFGYWQRSSADIDDLKTYLRRGGLGIEHILNSDWRIKQEFSASYNDGNDFGSLTQLTITPDDYWKLGLSYNSHSTDLPIRARIFDIESDNAEANITYRESEWRSYNMSVSHSKFSDGNKRSQCLLGYEQGLWVKNDWKEKIFIDAYASKNSLDNTDYFNPENDLSLSITHMTENTVRRIYRTAFVHRLYLSIGGYKQNGYSIEPIGSVRYEHDIEFSDTHSVLYGLSVGSQPYDGEAVTGYGLYLKWRLYF